MKYYRKLLEVVNLTNKLFIKLIMNPEIIYCKCLIASGMVGTVYANMILHHKYDKSNADKYSIEERLFETLNNSIKGFVNGSWIFIYTPLYLSTWMTYKLSLPIVPYITSVINYFWKK